LFSLIIALQDSKKTRGNQAQRWKWKSWNQEK